MKVYIVLTGYYDCEGGGDDIAAVFSSFEKAEQFVLNELAFNKDWKYYTRRIEIDRWDDDSGPNAMSESYVQIEEHEVR